MNVLHSFATSFDPTFAAENSAATSSPTLSVACCPFHDGLATLDLFLAELDRADTPLFDAALDLRTLAKARGPAAGDFVEQLLRIQRLLGERHYLAFYRVRSWARRALRVETRASPTVPWHTYPFPHDPALLDAIGSTTHVRFTFARPA